MKDPVHPGRIVRHDCLEPLGLSVTAGAKILGVSRQTLNKIVNGRSGITPEIRVGVCFSWLLDYGERRDLGRAFGLGSLSRACRPAL